MSINIDTAVNSWILSVPEDRRDEIANNYLKLGYLTSTLCQTSINPDSSLLKNINNQISSSLQTIDSSLKTMENNNVNKMSVIEAKISENLERVKGSIEKLTESNNKSVLKGNMGENFVASVIKGNFPDYTLLDMSKVAEASDYHLVLPSGDIFMIEVKNYSNVIPTKEIVKFKRDMIKNGSKIGIFISLNTGITGKKRFDIETLNHKQKILYIPNSGLDGSAIVWSVLLGRELVNSQLDALSINQEKIIDIYESFKFVYNKFCKIKYSIKDSKDVIEKQLSKLMHEALELDISIYETFKNVSTIINNELHFTNTLLMSAEYGECEIIVEEMLKNKDKRATIHKEILGFCKDNHLTVKYPPDNKLQWLIFDEEGKEFIKFKLTKTKVDLLLEDGNITISGNKKGLQYIKNNLV
jgi:hypothetical protein